MSALRVEVLGTSVNSAVSAAGDFSLQHVPAGDVSVKVSGSGADAVVMVNGVAEGATIQVRISVQGNQGSLDFVSRGGASGKVELEGLIESKTAPDMLVVNGQSVKVAATAEIRKGGTAMTFASLTVGWRVHVRGAISAPGVVPALLIADLVIVQNMGGGGGGGGQTAVHGALSALGGSCPALTFTVGGSTPVKTDSSTTFKPPHGGCAALKNGDSVTVEGMLVSGTLMASRVERN